MTKVTRIFTQPVEAEATGTEAHPLVTIALFSGIGLLLSLGVVLLDKYIPGEWF